MVKTKNVLNIIYNVQNSFPAVLIKYTLKPVIKKYIKDLKSPWI